MQSYSETFGHLFHESAYYVRCGVLSSSLWAAVQALLPLQNWEEEGGGGGTEFRVARELGGGLCVTRLPCLRGDVLVTYVNQGS